MSLGTGALKVGRGPEHFSPRQGGIHGNPVSKNHPCKQLPTGTITLNQITGNILTWPLMYLAKKYFKLLKEREGWGLNLLHPGILICNDKLESAKIC